MWGFYDGPNRKGGGFIMRRLRILLFVLAGLLALIALGVWEYLSTQTQVNSEANIPATVAVEIGDVLQSVDAPGLLVGTKEVLLGMGASGPIEKIFVKPGEKVEAGQILARLGNEGALNTAVIVAQNACFATERELQETYDNAPLETAQAKMNLVNTQEELQQALYKNQLQQEGHRASPTTMAAAEAKVALAQDEVHRAEQELKKLSGRPEDDPLRAAAQLDLAVAIQERDSALRSLNWYTGHPTELQQSMLDAEVAMAKAKLHLAELAWERVKDGPDADILEEKERELATAHAQLTEAEAALAGAVLYAPFSGVILEVNARPGDHLVAGVGFILLSNITAMEVAVSVIEEDYPQIRIGQTVELFFDARPDIEILGRVERIVPKRLPGDRPLYEVYISFQDVPAGLVAGMTADASILTDSREEVLRLPKSMVRSRSDGSAKLETWVNGQVEEHLVQVGLRGDSYVEIVSGLQEGDLVISEFGS
jgi:multidrug efflux pump subunit AcrA (membrane-fusion protein)